jgi:uncharacterized protein YbcI
MADQHGIDATVDGTGDLSTTIGSSLASVWARYVGARPAQAEMQLKGSVVRWVLTDGTSQFEQGMAAEPVDGSPAKERTLSGYKRETSAVVAKATSRRVVAMISNHDSKTGVATETFILETRPKQNG